MLRVGSSGAKPLGALEHLGLVGGGGSRGARAGIAASDARVARTGRPEGRGSGPGGARATRGEAEAGAGAGAAPRRRAAWWQREQRRRGLGKKTSDHFVKSRKSRGVSKK